MKIHRILRCATIASTIFLVLAASSIAVAAEEHDELTWAGPGHLPRMPHRGGHRSPRIGHVPVDRRRLRRWSTGRRDRARSPAASTVTASTSSATGTSAATVTSVSARCLRKRSSPTELENIDCLLCHQQAYKRKKVDGVFVPDTAAMQISMDEAVRTVHDPVRANCLQCHAKAGGGDAVKRGDLSLAQAATTDEVFDVHMATTGADLACQDCHTATDHRFAGRGSDLRPTDSAVELECTNCHAGDGHARGPRWIDHRPARRAHRLPDLPHPGLREGRLRQRCDRSHRNPPHLARQPQHGGAVSPGDGQTERPHPQLPVLEPPQPKLPAPRRGRSRPGNRTLPDFAAHRSCLRRRQQALSLQVQDRRAADHQLEQPLDRSRYQRFLRKRGRHRRHRAGPRQHGPRRQRALLLGGDRHLPDAQPPGQSGRRCAALQRLSRQQCANGPSGRLRLRPPGRRRASSATSATGPRRKRTSTRSTTSTSRTRDSTAAGATASAVRNGRSRLRGGSSATASSRRPPLPGSSDSSVVQPGHPRRTTAAGKSQESEPVFDLERQRCDGPNKTSCRLRVLRVFVVATSADGIKRPARPERALWGRSRRSYRARPGSFRGRRTSVGAVLRLQRPPAGASRRNGRPTRSAPVRDRPLRRRFIRHFGTSARNR